uniref:Uncharacterized protein n=1 Tax=Astatotilapia calliptera TaxID=8154 RepID=A0A3P8RAQ9_ASTCA
MMKTLGFLCALIYPILKELQAERVTGEDGTEEKMLGFWSLLVLSVLVGCICCVFSWMLTYLDSFQPGMDFPTLRTVTTVPWTVSIITCCEHKYL